MGTVWSMGWGHCMWYWVQNMGHRSARSEYGACDMRSGVSVCTSMRYVMRRYVVCGVECEIRGMWWVWVWICGMGYRVWVIVCVRWDMRYRHVWCLWDMWIRYAVWDILYRTSHIKPHIMPHLTAHLITSIPSHHIRHIAHPVNPTACELVRMLGMGCGMGCGVRLMG